MTFIECVLALSVCLHPTAPPAKPTPAPLPKSPYPSVLIVAGPQGVVLQEFTTLAKCAEASVYIRAGTNNRTVAECVDR